MHDGWDSLLVSVAGGNQVRFALLKAIVARESDGDPNAIGDDGTSFGLAQIHLPTARGLGYTGDARGLLDPGLNLRLASKLLNELEGQLGAGDGSRREVVSAYNCGATSSGGWRSRCRRTDGTFTNATYVEDVLTRFARYVWTPPSSTGSTGDIASGAPSGGVVVAGAVLIVLFGLVLGGLLEA